MRPLRHDDRANVAIPAVVLAVVLIAAVAVAIVFLGMGFSVGPGPRCEIHGVTQPTSTLIELRKHTIGNGAPVVTVVANAVSSPTDGRYSVSTTCGGFFSAMASKPGFFNSQRESLPFNGGETSMEINWALNQDPSQSPIG